MQLKNCFKFLFKSSTVFKFFALYCLLIFSTILSYDVLTFNNEILIAENSADSLDELISVLEKRIGKQEAIEIVKHQYIDQMIKDYPDITGFKNLIETLEKSYDKATIVLLLKQNFLLKKYLLYGKNFTDILISVSSFMDKLSFVKFIVSYDENIFKIQSSALCSNIEVYKKYFSAKELNPLFFKRADHLSSFPYIKNIVTELETILSKQEIKDLLLQESFYETILHDKKIYEVLKIFNSFMDKDRLRLIITNNTMSYFNTPYYLSLNSKRTLEIMQISRKYLNETDCFNLLESQDFISIFCNSSEITLETFEKMLKIFSLDEDLVSSSYLYTQGISNLILNHIIELYRAVVLTQNLDAYDFIYDFKYKNSILNRLIYLLKYNDPLFEMVENPKLKISGIPFQEFYNLSYNKLFTYLKNIVDTDTYNFLEQDPEFNAYIDSLSLIKLEKFKFSTFILHHALDNNLFNKLILKDYKNCLNFLKYLSSILSNIDPINFHIIINNHELIQKIFYFSRSLSSKYLEDFNNILIYLKEILTDEILLNYIFNHLEDISYILLHTKDILYLTKDLKNTIIDVLKHHNKDTVYRILNSNPDKLLKKSSILKLFNIKDCTSLFGFFKSLDIFGIFG